MQLSGVTLIIAFVVLSIVLDLFIETSAKWAVMAPVFVPMMMLLGYSPELTQAAYRIGDSVCNIITPLMSYFPPDSRLRTKIRTQSRHRNDNGDDDALLDRVLYRLDALLDRLVLPWFAPRPGSGLFYETKPATSAN